MANQCNGVDMDVLSRTLGELEKDPSLGVSQFRARNRWRGGMRTVNRIEGFHAVHQEMVHPQAFEMSSDEPAIIAGGESSPNPVEYLLGALASCMTSSMVMHAAVRGIEIQRIESVVEGDMDLNGLAGFSDQVPKGFQAIRVRMEVESDASADQLKELAEFSPTLDTIRRGTDVKVEIDRRPRRSPGVETTRA